jgi:hypothetical protein
LPHPLARNAVSCRELLKPDRRFGQEPRLKYAALARVEDFQGSGERPTPLFGFFLVGVHGFRTRCRVDEPVLHFAGLVCMHLSIE